MTIHNIPPVFDKDSRILILGSFPSVKSRDVGFFYGHPQNRFWKVLSSIFNEPLPLTIAEKKAFLKDTRVALWDVIASCEIQGSSDSSIKNAAPNDISLILSAAKIQKIFVNGKTAEKLYDKLILPSIGVGAVCLPSTSPANAAWTLDRLIQAWSQAILG